MAKAAPQEELTEQQITDILKQSDFIETSQSMDFGADVAKSDTMIVQTTRSARLIPMWNGDMQYNVPKVHFLQWQKEGLTTSKPATEEKLWFNCEICGKRLVAGAGLPARLLSTQKQKDRATKIAGNMHILRKHPNAAPILLDEKEYNLARQAISN